MAFFLKRDYGKDIFRSYAYDFELSHFLVKSFALLTVK